jgi:hypothetical protein
MLTNDQITDRSEMAARHMRERAEMALRQMNESQEMAAKLGMETQMFAPPPQALGMVVIPPDAPPGVPIDMTAPGQPVNTTPIPRPLKLRK